MGRPSGSVRGETASRTHARCRPDLARSKPRSAAAEESAGNGCAQLCERQLRKRRDRPSRVAKRWCDERRRGPAASGKGARPLSFSIDAPRQCFCTSRTDDRRRMSERPRRAKSFRGSIEESSTPRRAAEKLTGRRWPGIRSRRLLSEQSSGTRPPSSRPWIAGSI